MQITDSPNVSNFDFEVQLDIAQAVPKAIITDISTYIGSGQDNIIGIVVRIIDPSNLALPQTTYPPNVDIQPGLTDTEKNLPYFNGKVKFGIYKIYATLIDEDGDEYVWEDDDGTQFKSINLCQPNALSNATKNYGGLLLNVDPNCDLGMLIVQDGGTGFTYNGVSPAETEAALIITYPIDTTGTVSQKTATFIPFTFPLTVSGFYTIQGTVTQTYQLTSTTSVKAAYYYQKQFDVMCGYSLCKALCDYERLWQEIKECSIANPNQLTQKMRVFMLITGLIVKSIAFKNCGKKFGDLLEQFRIIGGFECNCECAPQGISPAPLFMSGGTIVKGNMCGDIDLTLTQFEGNFLLNLSDVTYEVIAAAAQSDWITVTPIEGSCSMTFQLSIDVCEMLGTVSIDCLSDVDTSSPPPADGDFLRWNEDLEVWEPSELTVPDWEDLTLGTNMSNAGGARQTAQIRKWSDGRVEVRGDVTGSNLPTNNTIATLAAEYRPVSTQHFPVNVNNLGTYYPGELQITSLGALTINNNTLGSGTSGTFSIMFSYDTAS